MRCARSRLSGAGVASPVRLRSTCLSRKSTRLTSTSGSRTLSTTAQRSGGASPVTPSTVLNLFLEQDAARRRWKVGLLSIPKFSVAVVTGLGLSGAIALKQNHDNRTRPVVLRAPASAAYGIKNDPLVYLGLWGMGICTSAAVGSLYGFMRMVRRFGKWSTHQPHEWLPHFAAVRALGRRTMVQTGLGTAALLSSIFIADRVLDRIFLGPYIDEARHSLFTLKNMPDPETVDAYIAATHTSHLIIATLLLSFTPHIILPSLISIIFVSAANYKIYMHATYQRNKMRIHSSHAASTPALASSSPSASSPASHASAISDTGPAFHRVLANTTKEDDHVEEQEEDELL